MHVQNTIRFKHILIADIGKNIADIYAQLGAECI